MEDLITLNNGDNKKKIVLYQLLIISLSIALIFLELIMHLPFILALSRHYLPSDSNIKTLWLEVLLKTFLFLIYPIFMVCRLARMQLKDRQMFAVLQACQTAVVCCPFILFFN